MGLRSCRAHLGSSHHQVVELEGGHGCVSFADIQICELEHADDRDIVLGPLAVPEQLGPAFMTAQPRVTKPSPPVE